MTTDAALVSEFDPASWPRLAHVAQHASLLGAAVVSQPGFGLRWRDAAPLVNALGSAASRAFGRELVVEAYAVIPARQRPTTLSMPELDGEDFVSVAIDRAAVSLGNLAQAVAARGTWADLAAAMAVTMGRPGAYAVVRPESRLPMFEALEEVVAVRERLSTDIADDIETTRAAAAALSARTRTKEGMARLRSLGERLGNLRAESTAPTLLGAILETLEAGAVVSLGESHDHRHLELLVFTRNRALLDELHVQSS